MSIQQESSSKVPAENFPPHDDEHASLNQHSHPPKSGQTVNVTIFQQDTGPHEKKQVCTCSAANDWYDYESYIEAAFRSSRTNEVFLFSLDEYMLLNYEPGTTAARVLKGPLRVRDGFRSLRYLAFGEYGIDCAFSSIWKDKAFIFSMGDCALFNYVDDSIKKGPMSARRMFPFLTGTGFGIGIDAAFEITKEPEAYIFEDNKYARINYGRRGRIIDRGLITEGFPCLRGTIFESGVAAAFASHKCDEAYLFKDDSYALINFASDCIIDGVKKILPNWPSLCNILPRKRSPRYDENSPPYDELDSGCGVIDDDDYVVDGVVDGDGRRQQRHESPATSTVDDEEQCDEE